MLPAGDLGGLLPAEAERERERAYREALERAVMPAPSVDPEDREADLIAKTEAGIPDTAEARRVRGRVAAKRATAAKFAERRDAVLNDPGRTAAGRRRDALEVDRDHEKEQLALVAEDVTDIDRLIAREDRPQQLVAPATSVDAVRVHTAVVLASLAPLARLARTREELRAAVARGEQPMVRALAPLVEDALEAAKLSAEERDTTRRVLTEARVSMMDEAAYRGAAARRWAEAARRDVISFASKLVAAGGRLDAVEEALGAKMWPTLIPEPASEEE